MNKPLRGETKLQSALELFGVDAQGRIALDLGASTGGFTQMLLKSGATRVYAVDAGFGQLLGSLRQDSRVINLERVNVADLSVDQVSDPMDLLSIDVSYLSLASAVQQLCSRIVLNPGCILLGLVKPMFELRLATAPRDSKTAWKAIDQAARAISDLGWRLTGTAISPVRGTRGAIEGWVYAVSDSGIVARSA